MSGVLNDSDGVPSTKNELKPHAAVPSLLQAHASLKRNRL